MSSNGVERPAVVDREVEKAVCRRSEAADLAVHLLTSQFFSHRHDVLCTERLHFLEGDGLLEWNAVK